MQAMESSRQAEVGVKASKTVEYLSGRRRDVAVAVDEWSIYLDQWTEDLDVELKTCHNAVKTT